MFDFESLVAKSQLYFQRAGAADNDDERAIWQLLAFEFAIRAPLAKVSPALLASNEGDAILHAVGVPVSVQKVTSISSTLVLARLEKVIPDLGSDRTKGAQRVLAVRNAEVHTSEAAVASTDRREWLPPMLDILEVICQHLQIPLTDLIAQDQVDEASQYRQTARNEVRGLVGQKIMKAKEFVLRLSPEEIIRREAAEKPHSGFANCPACGHDALTRVFEPARAEKSSFNEDSGEIVYEWRRIVRSAKCGVCGLDLDNTAEVIAAGVRRSYDFSTSESRYDGWEEAIPMSEIQELVGYSDYDGPEYMDE